MHVVTTAVADVPNAYPNQNLDGGSVAFAG